MGRSGYILIVLGLIVASMTAPAQLPFITNQPSSRALWAGGSVRFSAGVSNSGAFSFQWQFNSTNLPNGIITTVAGGGSGSDGSAATSAALNAPYGIAIAAPGDLIIADSISGRIRKVDTNGMISTVAGNGHSGVYTNGQWIYGLGDGGSATNSCLGFVPAVIADSYGNIFISDTSDAKVRKVDTNGIITTVAGNGTAGYGGDGGPATNANLHCSAGLALDSRGNLFIADEDNNCIRKVDTNGTITTVVTNLSLPLGITAESAGNLLIAENQWIVEQDTNGIVTTFAGDGTGQPGFSGDGGPATGARMAYPFATVADPSGVVFIADSQNERIREVDTTGIITTMAGNSAGYPRNAGGFSGDGDFAVNAGLNYPMGLAEDSAGDLFIADSGNNRIRKITNTRGPCLTLNNVTPANSGKYQVVVTGPGGSATSIVANLVVTTRPLVYQAVCNQDGSMTLKFVTTPNSTNEVLCTANLSPPVCWQTLSTNVAGPDGHWQFIDPNASGSPSRFYRSLTR